ncbi:MAG TPA: hypothetical protein VGF69_15785 [Thermoanaerobaculia bacterium]|jgi:hypothetical protein
MQFFTPEMRRVRIDDPFVLPVAQLTLEPPAVRPLLPPALRTYSETRPLHDAWVHELVVEEAAAVVSLRAVIGDGLGYEHIRIEYGDATIVSDRELVTIVENDESEIVEEELDVVDGRYEHRLLFDPVAVIVIGFSGFSCTREPVSVRRRGRRGQRLKRV